MAQCAGEAQCGHAVYFNDKCWKKKGRGSEGLVKAGANARVGVKQ
jgi:hypothetical protein